jgi:hypothetical protein
LDPLQFFAYLHRQPTRRPTRHSPCKASIPPGLSAIPQARFPTGIVVAIVFFSVSTTATAFERPVETRSSLPSLEIAVPIGKEPVGAHALQLLGHFHLPARLAGAKIDN